MVYDNRYCMAYIPISMCFNGRQNIKVSIMDYWKFRETEHWEEFRILDVNDKPIGRVIFSDVSNPKIYLNIRMTVDAMHELLDSIDEKKHDVIEFLEK